MMGAQADPNGFKGTPVSWLAMQYEYDLGAPNSLWIWDESARSS
jgi:hypothetical protein